MGDELSVTAYSGEAEDRPVTEAWQERLSAVEDRGRQAAQDGGRAPSWVARFLTRPRKGLGSPCS